MAADLGSGGAEAALRDAGATHAQVTGTSQLKPRAPEGQRVMQLKHRTPEGQRAMLVVGVGDPVVDTIVHVDAAFLATVTSEPGGSLCITAEDNAALLQRLRDTGAALTQLRGGSAANVVACLAQLGAGDCCLTGGVGSDEAAESYEALLRESSVTPALVTTSTSQPTATSLCLVTPDGQRTMRTCLGAAQLFSAQHLPALDGAALVHLEGYCLFKPEMAAAAMARAHEAGACVTLDLASFEAVRHCSDALTALLTGAAVDVLFCNEDEACAVAAVLAPQLRPDADAPLTDAGLEALLDALLANCSTVVCTLGARGAVARSRGSGPCVRAAAPPVAAIADTVGAGDHFCGAFLAAHLLKASLKQCLEAGCVVGSRVVQHVGAQLPHDEWAALRRGLAHILGQWSDS